MGRGGGGCHLERVIREHMERLARLERLGWLAAGLTHDLNNTLSCVLGEIAEIGARLRELQGSTEAAAAAEAIEACQGSLERMGGALQTAVGHGRELQRLYRGESLPPAVWRVDLRDAAMRAMSIAPGKVRAMLELTGPSAFVAVDRETLVRVLLNLIINAAAAVEARSDPRRIRIHIAPAERWATCDVIDNGRGVAREILPRLFEPFATTRPEGSGTGLGLAVSRHLLRAAGGDLLLAETGPQGSTFRLLLPLSNDGQAQRVTDR
jgi:signal transduction histidine kinase